MILNAARWLHVTACCCHVCLNSNERQARCNDCSQSARFHISHSAPEPNSYGCFVGKSYFPPNVKFASNFTFFQGNSSPFVSSKLNLFVESGSKTMYNDDVSRAPVIIIKVPRDLVLPAGSQDDNKSIKSSSQS